MQFLLLCVATLRILQVATRLAIKVNHHIFLGGRFLHRLVRNVRTFSYQGLILTHLTRHDSARLINSSGHRLGATRSDLIRDRIEA